MIKVIQKTNKFFLLSILSLISITVANNSVYAETATYQTQVSPSIMITMPTDLIEVVVDPSNKPFDSADFSVSVSTNNLTGYYMTMSSNTTDLVKTNDITKTIPTLSTNENGYTEETFETNKWGYKIGSGNYVPFVSGVRIAGADTPTNGDVTNLAFATKVDFLQSEGVYRGVLEFFVVGNPLPLTIQNLPDNYCTTDPVATIDSRDGQEYIIQRLADGNCWMMDNLNLGATDINMDLNKDNTNVEEPISVATFNSWRKESGTSIFDAPELIPVDGIDSVAGTKYGTLYNFCAASAGTICTTANSEDSTSDLCPAGWRIPTGNDDGEFGNLYAQEAYNTAAKMRASISDGGAAFANAGYARWSLTNQGSEAWYWSSTHQYNDYMYNLYINSSGNVSTSYTRNRQYLLSVRCIKKKDITSVVYLQDLTPQIIEETAIGTTATLKDKRDNENYLVGKLADGNVWLLENLRLDISTVPLENLQGNTNAPDDALNYLKNGGGTSPYAINAISTNPSTLTSEQTSGHIFTSFRDTNETNHAKTGTSKIGVFYNYCAVSAGTYCMSWSMNTFDNDATQDICPAGWRLPTNPRTTNTIPPSGDLGNLYIAYGSDMSALTAAFNTIPSYGYYSTPYLAYNGGYNGGGNNPNYLWTASSETNNSMRLSIIGPGETYWYAGGTDRTRAFSVRCLAKTE